MGCLDQMSSRYVQFKRQLLKAEAALRTFAKATDGAPLLHLQQLRNHVATKFAAAATPHAFQQSFKAFN